MATGEVLTPKPLHFKNFGGVVPAFTQDGQSLYYTGMRESRKRMEAGFIQHIIYRHDIGSTQRDEAVMTPPVQMQFTGRAKTTTN